MRSLVVASALAALFGAAQATVLYNNGPAVNTAPVPLSIQSTGAGSFSGFNAQAPLNNYLADDFIVPTGQIWNITSIDFYAFSVGATSFPFTSATWSIVRGNVNTGTVVASGTTSLFNASSGPAGYRVTSSNTGDRTRAIWVAEADIPDASFTAGTYWLRWSLSGGLSANGPFVPPVADGRTGNAQQSLGVNNVFAPLLDGTNGPSVELPFQLNGVASPVPEPGALSLLLAGGLAVVGVARRRAAR